LTTASNRHVDLDSEDGRKHTPLSDAAAQGMKDVVVYLLEVRGITQCSDIRSISDQIYLII
jgi:hypothetical protein